MLLAMKAADVYTAYGIPKKDGSYIYQKQGKVIILFDFLQVCTFNQHRRRFSIRCLGAYSSPNDRASPATSRSDSGYVMRRANLD